MIIYGGKARSLYLYPTLLLLFHFYSFKLVVVTNGTYEIVNGIIYNSPLFFYTGFVLKVKFHFAGLKIITLYAIADVVQTTVILLVRKKRILF